jgi:hypothetical protein
VDSGAQAVSGLAGTVPVVVEEEAWEETAEEIDDLVLGIGDIWRAPLFARRLWLWHGVMWGRLCVGVFGVDRVDSRNT